jgi:hypothetical protein
MFGTHCHERNIWPPTGIPDAEFPLEQDGSALGLMRTLGRQLVYPFQSLSRRV